MKTATSLAETRSIIQQWRQFKHSTALVPTMGNLHAGHLALVKRARAQANKVVVSIFVNPTQFAPGEDYRSYPRTESEDAALLREAGVDLLFMPTAADMYPPGTQTRIHVGDLANILCGASRPGHFDGVATVVAKLFNIIQPDQAYFGLKDYQQWQVINALVQDLNLPIALHSVATLREPDGLAMSSRNTYLTDSQRQIAPILWQTLSNIAQTLAEGQRDYSTIAQQGSQRLTQAGFEVDYVDIREAASLAPATDAATDKIILAAAKLGQARLIDNLLCPAPSWTQPHNDNKQEE
ncbi:MAG: pantoate--beta-alanine ligase [Methylococcales bacterium]|nr:pantoate--beta-alanine ligase [Methylococcales bacterium]